MRAFVFGILPWTLLPAVVFFAGCDDDDDDDVVFTEGEVDPRFEEAEALSARWCLEAQIALPGLDGSSLGEADIEHTVLGGLGELSQAKSSIDPDSDRPIKPVSIMMTMATGGEPGVPAQISKEAYCKLKAQDGIERGLGVEIDGTEGTCDQMNERALIWAIGKLTEREKARYVKEGNKLAFGPDIVGDIGPEWYTACSEFTVTDGVYWLAADALVVPYDDYPDVQEELKGVHYCKLLPPAQALYWLLYRAFWDDPIGQGPNSDPTAALLCEHGCELADATPKGSCIFYFATSGQHFCEDYTGTAWTAASAEAKCNSRQPEDGKAAVYSASPCADRVGETSAIDGDGAFKGICAINCGTADEYRWNVYSAPEDMSIEEGCPTDWFPADIL